MVKISIAVLTIIQ